MKVLIWIGCFLVSSIIQTLVFQNVVRGAIPAVIIYSATIAVARSLCKAWDNRNGNTVKYSDRNILYCPSCAFIGSDDNSISNQKCPKCHDYLKKQIFQQINGTI